MTDAHMDPVNAAVRFLAELAALAGIIVGVRTGTGSWALAALVAVAAMAIWGIFRVPDDPGPAPMAIPGVVRLAIEALVFGGGVLGLWVAGGEFWAVLLAGVLVVHYATTPERMRHVLSFRL